MQALEVHDEKKMIAKSYAYYFIAPVIIMYKQYTQPSHRLSDEHCCFNAPC